MKDLFTVQNTEVSISFTKNEGRLASLYSKAAGKEFLNPDTPSAENSATASTVIASCFSRKPFA